MSKVSHYSIKKRALHVLMMGALTMKIYRFIPLSDIVCSISSFCFHCKIHLVQLLTF